MPITEAYYQLWLQQWADEQLELGPCLIAAPPLSWQTAAVEERLLSERCLLTLGRGCSGLLAVLHPAIVFSLSITTQPIHLPLLPPCFSACRSSTERIEMWRRRRRRSRKWRESRELNESHMNRRRGWLIKGIAQHYKKRAYICLLEMRGLFG